MSAQRTPPAQVVDNGVNALSIRFYVSDPSAGSVARVEVSLPSATPGGSPVVVDYALASYTTVSGANKTALRTILIAIRDETLTKESFA